MSPNSNKKLEQKNFARKNPAHDILRGRPNMGKESKHCQNSRGKHALLVPAAAEPWSALRTPKKAACRQRRRSTKEYPENAPLRVGCAMNGGRGRQPEGLDEIGQTSTRMIAAEMEVSVRERTYRECRAIASDSDAGARANRRNSCARCCARCCGLSLKQPVCTFTLREPPPGSRWRRSSPVRISDPEGARRTVFS
jgi:hypothetical protein